MIIINLVFEGGGIKGLCYIGVMKAFEERGIKINKVAGTSVGALFASLISAGYRSNEIIDIIESIDIEKLWKRNNNIIYKTKEIIANKSIYDVSLLEELLEEVLSKKNITKFIDVKQGDDYNLKVISTIIKPKSLVVIPNDLKKYNIDPDNFKISKAVSMSCAIPLVYQNYKLNGYRFVDGGIADNFPIWLFDNPIGVRVNGNNKIIKLINNFYKKDKIKMSNLENIISIDTTGFNAIKFIDGLNCKSQLINRGYYYAKQFLDNLMMNKN